MSTPASLGFEINSPMSSSRSPIKSPNSFDTDSASFFVLAIAALGFLRRIATLASLEMASSALSAARIGAHASSRRENTIGVRSRRGMAGVLWIWGWEFRSERVAGGQSQRRPATLVDCAEYTRQ